MKVTLTTTIVALVATILMSTTTSLCTDRLTRDLPFIKTLARTQNFKDVPVHWSSSSRCEMDINAERPSLIVVQHIAGPRFRCFQANAGNGTFCTVKDDVRDMTSNRFTLVTAQLCEWYGGLLQITSEAYSPCNRLHEGMATQGLGPKHLHPYTIPSVSLPNLTTANVDNILTTTPTNMGQVDLVEELTLRIQCDPIVSPTAPFNTKSLTIKTGGAAAHDSYNTPQWQVVLTRVGGNGDSLDIQLRSPSHSRLPTNFRSVNVIYHQRHLASVLLNESAFSNWGELKLSFPVEKALNGERYEFDIILSTQHQPTESPKLAPLLSSPSLLRPSSASKSTKHKSTLSGKDHPSSSSPSSRLLDPTQSMMKMFLRDRRSVDVQFLFETEFTPSGRVAALWAHRLVLSRYLALDALVRSAESCENGCTFGPVTVRMPHSISLAAFSALLYYLYTGKVQLSMLPDMFALSQIDLDSTYAMHNCAQFNTNAVIVDGLYLVDTMPSCEVICKPLVDWCVKDAESLWSAKGIPCRELHSTAKHFGITDLQELCLEGMVESIDASNVVEMLFEFGGSSVTVREAGLSFVNENLAVLFAEGRDPFLRFREREECYVIMVEVMRSFTKQLKVASHGTGGSGRH
ncbi:hypothetical protein BGX30_010350 [Mortierella sp. GBA39]|nr:hypothetical protein BGX30_010350 [Mortierella sp. GBA39]